MGDTVIFFAWQDTRVASETEHPSLLKTVSDLQFNLYHLEKTIFTMLLEVPSDTSFML